MGEGGAKWNRIFGKVEVWGGNGRAGCQKGQVQIKL